MGTYPGLPSQTDGVFIKRPPRRNFGYVHTVTPGSRSTGMTCASNAEAMGSSVDTKPPPAAEAKASSIDAGPASAADIPLLPNLCRGTSHAPVGQGHHDTIGLTVRWHGAGEHLCLQTLISPPKPMTPSPDERSVGAEHTERGGARPAGGTAERFRAARDGVPLPPRASKPLAWVARTAERKSTSGHRTTPPIRSPPPGPGDEAMTMR